MKKEDNIQMQESSVGTSMGNICKMRRSRTTFEGAEVEITKPQKSPLKEKKRKKRGGR